jgi:FKBP-type peptidyl-prolyl cis-trans isomerase
MTGTDELRIEELAPGDGPTAEPETEVTIRFTATLEDGTPILRANEPYTFLLDMGEVIVGLDRGVTGMRAGGKRRLTIPPSLGYANRGAPGIPKGATLVFEVELLAVSR